MSTPTAIMEQQPTQWNSMPGWDIAVDLIPPELVNARRLTVLRKLMAAGIIALLVLCAGGYYLATRDNASAAADLAAVQDQTAQLQAQGRQYSGVVSIQGSVSQVETQIAQVMSGDVDLAGLMGAVQNALPSTMTISQESITISIAAVAGGASATPSGGLDTSGLPRIGTISLTGTGQTLNDLSDFVDRLSTVPGLVDVLPISNTASETGTTQYNLTIALTDELLSHRYDVGAG
jgi:hypothetical protein